MKNLLFALILMAGMASCCSKCQNKDAACVCEPNCKIVEEHCGCHEACGCRI